MIMLFTNYFAVGVQPKAVSSSSLRNSKGQAFTSIQPKYDVSYQNVSSAANELF